MTRSKRSSKTTILSVALICLSVLIILASSLAFFTDKRDTTSNVSFGKIEISTDESFKKLSVPVTDVLPGSKLTDAITFSKAVDSESMYVRAKVYFDTTSEVADVKMLVAELNAYDLDVANESEEYQWSDKYGRFYYLLDKTNTENVYEITNSNTIKLSNGFSIPTSLTQLDNYAQYFEDITLNIEIQAIQSYGVDAELPKIDEYFGALTNQPAFADPSLYKFNENVVIGLSDAGENLKYISIPSSYKIVAQKNVDYVFNSYEEAMEFGDSLMDNRELYELFRDWEYERYEQGKEPEYPATFTVRNETYDYGDDVSVTSIGKRAFSDCSSLTSITIPDSVTSIGEYAFSGCTGLQNTVGDLIYIKTTTNDYYYLYGTKNTTLTSATINENCKFIDDYAFGYCRKLESVTFGENSQLTSIGGSAFYDCSSLTSITIPSGVTSIGDYAFYNCSSLTSITIPNGVMNIEKSTFRSCSSLTSITISDGVTSIGSEAFSGCNKLTSITIPDSVTSIGDSAFSGCNKLTSITIPDSVTSIGDSAFSGCSKLENVTFGENSQLTSIGGYVFQNCSSLTSITIPDGVTSIDDWAFDGCSSLTSITIPSSVTSIGIRAFLGCTGLQNTVGNLIYIKTTTNDYYYLYDTTNTTLTSATINENCRFIGYEAFRSCSSLTSITIPSGVTSIGGSAFSGCSSLTSVTFGEGSQLTSIGTGAFYGCSGLTSITIPDGVTSIGTGAFDGCSSLTSVTYTKEVAGKYRFVNGTLTILDGGMTDSPQWYTDNLNQLILNVVFNGNETSIGSYAFKGCSSLTSIMIPNSVTSIESYAFSSCSKLTSIMIPNSVTSIESYAFSSCSKLTSIMIPNSVTSIGGYAFSGCSSLTSIMIPNSVTSIGGYAFSSCSKLTSITIPDSVTSIGGSAFSGCSKLENVTFGENSQLTSIGGYAFSGCSSLTSIMIPNSVTSIGSYAFYNCSSLTSITIPDGVTSIGFYAFSGCSSLTSITIPESVTSIGWAAFSGCSLTSVTYTKEVTGKYRFVNGTLTILDGGMTDDPQWYKDNLNPLILNVVFNGNETSIGNYAFQYCYNLSSITIPESVTSIGYYTFRGCSSLTSVTFGNTSGWFVADSSTATSGTNVTLTNTSTNATYLKSTYYNKYWIKKSA